MSQKSKKDLSEAKNFRITEADLKITAPVVLKGMVENAGDVILLKAEAATEIERTC